MRVLVTGSSGQLGSEIVKVLSLRSEARRRDPIEVFAPQRDELDLSRRDSVLSAVVAAEPDVVFHPAAFTAVDRCETEPETALLVNALGTRHVAEACRLGGAHLVYLSTDYVFDGEKSSPYNEWDTPNPLSVYGRTKLAGEHEVGPLGTTVRTSWVVGRTGSNMLKTVFRLASDPDAPLRFVDDQHGCVTLASDLAGVVVELGLARRPGLFHVTNQGATTWFDFAREVCALAGLRPERVEPIASSELVPPRPAPRPANSVLDNACLRLSGLPLLPDWRESLSGLVRELAGTSA